MFGLPLDNTRLVVLSACDTGRAEATHANEVIGLVRALIYAGARTLVLSFWEVDSDATALWMRVSTMLRSLGPIAEAARVALTRVKSNPAYSHPYYWAAFDDRPLAWATCFGTSERAYPPLGGESTVQRSRQLRALRVRLSGGPISPDRDRRRHRSGRARRAVSVRGRALFRLPRVVVPSMLLILLPVVFLLCGSPDCDVRSSARRPDRRKDGPLCWRGAAWCWPSSRFSS